MDNESSQPYWWIIHGRGYCFIYYWSEIIWRIYEDKTFSFITKLPPVSELIKKELKLEKGSSKTGREEVGALTRAKVEKIAQEKMADLNTEDLEAAKKIVEGTARSMGVVVK